MTTSPAIIDYADPSFLLDLPVGTLRPHVSRGRIPHVRLTGRIVRFSCARLQAWISSRTVSGGAQNGKGVDRG